VIGRRNQDLAREARNALGDVPAQLAALREMTVSELRERWLDLYGYPTASRNRDHLRKRLAWRVQEIVEGGLSQRARDRIEQLLDGHFLPDLTRRARQDATAKNPESAPKDRDPRLPPVGTVIRKTHRGTQHVVTVLEEGFEYRGEQYRSLSAVAKVITDANWNGLLFFGLTRRKSVRRVG